MKKSVIVARLYIGFGAKDGQAAIDAIDDRFEEENTQ